MSSSTTDNERAFVHTITVFSVSSAMIGVCLTAIGLVKIVAQASRIETLCDDLIVIDAITFGIAALLAFRGLQRFVRHQTPRSHELMDGVFFLALALMIVLCAIFAWSVL